MGGFGSGRTGGKPCAEDKRRIDVRQLHRDGRLQPGATFGWSWTRGGETVATIDFTVEADRVWLHYRQRQPGQDWQERRYPVGLERTPCHLGGERVWWRCPAVGCGRRVAVLHGGAVFACRHCHKLAYRSQRETATDRAIRRAGQLRKRLGWVPGIAHGEGPRPKGMHERTFMCLRAEYYALVRRALGGMGEELDRQRQSLRILERKYQ